jgi:formyltetrahydrofolate deformylase
MHASADSRIQTHTSDGQRSLGIGRLLVKCADRHGIVAAISSFLFAAGANIISSDQYSDDPEHGTFFLRTEFHLDGLESSWRTLEARFAEEVANPLSMEWMISYPWVRRRIALFASRAEHCLLDLLWRWRRGELDNADVIAVISNHRHHELDVSLFGTPFHHVPVSAQNRALAEAEMLDLIGDGVDLVVLARYMQVLSKDFLERVGAPVINIHHSFLPAFVGAKPYEQARERGVKIIGATAHYITENLDDGPIIAQDVIHCNHRDTLDDLVRKGRDVERRVLAEAVRLHTEDRVLVYQNKTVVF